MTKDRIVHHRTDRNVSFVWHRGPYIDVFWSDALRLSGDDAIPFTNIGIWDSGTDKATISTEGEFVATCDEWLAGVDAHDMGGYLEQSL